MGRCVRQICDDMFGAAAENSTAVQRVAGLIPITRNKYLYVQQILLNSGCFVVLFSRLDVCACICLFLYFCKLTYRTYT